MNFLIYGLGTLQTAAFVSCSGMSESRCESFKSKITVPHSCLGLQDGIPVDYQSQVL